MAMLIKQNHAKKQISPLDPISSDYQRFTQSAPEKTRRALGSEVVYLHEHIKDKKLINDISKILIKVEEANRMEYLQKIVDYYKSEKKELDYRFICVSNK